MSGALQRAALALLLRSCWADRRGLGREGASGAGAALSSAFKKVQLYH